MPERKVKKLRFFNQVLFFGFLATLSQIIFVWPFIGVQALLFLIVVGALGISLYLNSQGKYKISQWIFVIVVNVTGTYTTLLLGGAALYHIQALLILISCLIIFDFKTEKEYILFGVPFMLASILIGELGLFGAPDFSSHEFTPIARAANISSLIIISVVFIAFILRLNNENEEQLEKKRKELEAGKDELEALVQKRTNELEIQKSELIQQNKDKEILLKEVHHRVRNNLQIIISLVNLQLSKINDPETANALLEIQSRVESMSLVHRRMYETSDFQKIVVSEYIEKIAENMKSLYGFNHIDFQLKVPEAFSVEIEHAIPFGLITNEILSNYFKHGMNLNADQKDIVDIQIAVANKSFTFFFKDNGPGFGNDLETDRQESLGLMLIDNLVGQLDGQLELYNDNGAAYRITVPLSN